MSDWASVVALQNFWTQNGIVLGEGIASFALKKSWAVTRDAVEEYRLLYR
jgi:hypothetical protein